MKSVQYVKHKTFFLKDGSGEIMLKFAINAGDLKIKKHDFRTRKTSEARALFFKNLRSSVQYREIDDFGAFG